MQSIRCLVDLERNVAVADRPESSTLWWDLSGSERYAFGLTQSTAADALQHNPPNGMIAYELPDLTPGAQSIVLPSDGVAVTADGHLAAAVTVAVNAKD